MTDALGTSLKRRSCNERGPLWPSRPPSSYCLPPTFTDHEFTKQGLQSQHRWKKEREKKKALCRLRGGKSAARAQRVGLSRENQLCLFLPVCRCAAVRTHLYSDWVRIMLSVWYNLEYCMQNGPYWLSHGAAYKKGSAQTYTDNPLRKQRPAGSSNEYKTPHKSRALARHPASALSRRRQWGRCSALMMRNHGGSGFQRCLSLRLLLFWRQTILLLLVLLFLPPSPGCEAMRSINDQNKSGVWQAGSRMFQTEQTSLLTPMAPPGCAGGPEPQPLLAGIQSQALINAIC